MYTKITCPPENIQKNRWLEDLSNDQHHKLNCLSSSSIKHIAEGNSYESFNEIFIKHTAKKFSDDTSRESFRVGTIAHLAIHEPDKFETNVLVCDLDQRTNKYDEYIIEKFNFENPESQNINTKIQNLETELSTADTKEQIKVIKDKIKKLKSEIQKPEILYGKNGGILVNNDEIFVVKSSEYEMYRTFQKRVANHPRLSFYMLDTIAEQSGVAQDPQTGLWLSIRGDSRNPRGLFLDSKTIDKPLTSKNLQNYVSNYYLNYQAVHYINTANLIEPNTYKEFIFIFLCKKPPYEIATAILSREDIQRTNVEWRKIINKISECEQSNKWPSADYDEESQDYGLIISLPPWSYK